MEEKIKDQEVLLVKEQGDEKLKVVAGMDEKGNLKTVPPKKEHEPDFMKIDKHSNVLENFFSNFMRQAKDPSHFGFFKVEASNIEEHDNAVSNMLQDTGDEFKQKYLNTLRVNPEDYAQSQQEQKSGYQPLNPDRIDWAQFELIGVSRESIENSNTLEAMLNYRKSPELIPVVIKVDDMTLRTDARLSLKEQPDGRITLNVHAIRSEPQLDRQFYGNNFTDEDKKALRETGNLGRLIDLKIPGKDDVRAFVSIDRLTNDIIALSADKVRVPDEIKGVKLSEQQKKELLEGKGVYVEGMTAKNGKSFNATLQFNADKRGIEFQFGNTLKESQKQGQQQSESQKEEAAKVLRVPNKLLGRDVSPEEQAQLKEGKVVYMEGLKDQKGEPFNAYVKPDFKEGRFRFITPSKYEKNQVTPDNASKTQLAVNSEGKTNEATKDVKEPLKKGQSEPTQEQKQHTYQRQWQQNKPNGGIKR